jgi:type II secretory pathway pseudopilin PulG
MKNSWARSGARNQRGDTIVEVIIAVAVISSVLAGAFTVSQASTLGVRNSQEHAETLNILQSQVEYVRSMALQETSNTSGVFDPTYEVYCINDSNPAAPVIVEIPFGGGAIPPIASDNFTAYPAACKKGQDSRYHVAIEYNQTDGVFRFSGRWDRLGGGQKNNAELKYRIYPGATP